ncbi:unnamed protein product, partial [Amoebophrya sp. A25]
LPSRATSASSEHGRQEKRAVKAFTYTHMVPGGLLVGYRLQTQFDPRALVLDDKFLEDFIGRIAWSGVFENLCAFDNHACWIPPTKGSASQNTGDSGLLKNMSKSSSSSRRDAVRAGATVEKGGDHDAEVRFDSDMNNFLPEVAMAAVS